VKSRLHCLGYEEDEHCERKVQPRPDDPANYAGETRAFVSASESQALRWMSGLLVSSFLTMANAYKRVRTATMTKSFR
jgi:hypothetical protein